MMHHTIAFCILYACACWFGLPITYSQCPLFTSSSIAGAGTTLCEGANLTLSVSGQNFTTGSSIQWYLGMNNGFDAYGGEGDLLGSVPIEMASCNNSPVVLYIMVNPDNIQVGSSDDKCDEFIVIWTGSGGFSTTDIFVSNIGNGAFFWNDFVAGNAGSYSCGVSLPPGPVPPNAILIIQGSPTNNVFVDIDNLCTSGLPVYIIANNNTDCTGDFFDNNAPCSSCPVMIDIAGSCPVDLNIDYMPPVASIEGWGWANTGSGIFANVVPPVNIPVFIPDVFTIDNFDWTIPANFCELNGEGTYFINGILAPPPTGVCADIYTQYFPIDISCPQMILSGGGDVCLGNCPDNPTEITFEIIGDDVPFEADIIVSISIFPDLPINNLEISNGQKIFVCMDGFFPSFDPGTGILEIPEFAVGIGATVQVISLTSASGCQVELAPDFITLNFIDAPTADAGNDVEICPGEDVMLDGDIGGSATAAQWTTNGDGSFLNPSDLTTPYTPGPLDILNGSVELTLTSMDANGSCTPAESNITIVIDPAIMIDLGPPLTVCDNDVVNLSVIMTGGSVDGEWNTNGDGAFDDPFDQNTFYTPGPSDFNLGFVTIFFDVTEPDACIGSNEPLTVTFVEAPQVDIPQDLEICEGESATIQIAINGSFTNVIWSTLGDGQFDIINDMEVIYTPGPDDVLEGTTIVSVTVESAFDECGQTTYNIPLIITLCNCPDIETSPPSSALCALNDVLDLSTLLEVGGAGEWAISSMPAGSNPAMIVGNILMTNSSDPGIYTVTYTLDNPEPGCPFSSSEMIEVVGLIVPDAGPDIANCGPGAIAILGMPTPSSPVSVLWESLGDGSFANPSSQATIYSPGSLDSISSNVSLVFHIIDPLCGNQSDTLNVLFNEPPYTFFPNDTFSICNEADKGSIINFPSLIAGGDAIGIWSNTGGAPVDFSNPSSVDFDGIAEGFYSFSYETNSAVIPCQDVTYIIIISVEDCLCPVIAIQSLPGGICNSQQDLPLNAFVIAGAPGTWQTLIMPPGSNPAIIIGSVLQIQGADPGIYRLRFTFDSAPIVACADSAEIEVLIQDQPLISISGDTTICGLGDVPLNAIIGGSATNAIWFTSGSGIFDNTIALNPTYSSSIADLASGQVRLIARTSDTLGFCVAALDTMFLNLVTPPFTNWSSLRDTICNQPDSGSVVNLLSFITGGDQSGIWTDEDGSMVNLSNPTQVDFNGVVPGNYRFSYLTQSAISPCQDTMYTFNVIVEDCSCPALEIIHTNLIFCEGDQANLESLLIINVAPGAWTISDGPSGIWPQINGNNLITTNAVAGNYTLTYTLSDSIPGCPASDNVKLIVEEKSTITLASVVCDPVMMNYSVIVETNAQSIIADFGVITNIGIGQFKIDNIPIDQDILIESVSMTQACFSSLFVDAPNCVCTLVTENISDTILLCPGDTFVLIPFITGAQGLAFSTWISDDTLMRPTLSLFEANTWIWIVRDSAGCEQRDTFDVALRELIVFDASGVSPACEGMTNGLIIINDINGGAGFYTIQVDGSPPFLSGSWPDTITNLGIGIHLISVTNPDGCELKLSMIIEDVSTGSVDLGPNASIQLGDSVFIDPVLNNIIVANADWNPNIHAPGIESFWYRPGETTLVSLTVTDSSGCSYEDEVLVTVIIDLHFYIPTIFSPNGDQINDILQVETSSNPIDIRSLEIFDRWGNLVYGQYGSPPFVWDGTFKNQRMMSGVYVLKLIWKDEDGNDQFYLNDLTLIR